MHVLDLEGMNLFLGMAWPQTCGKVIMKEMTTIFQYKGQTLEIRDTYRVDGENRKGQNGVNSSEPLLGVLEGCPMEEATWEDAFAIISNQFPRFSNTLVVQEGCIDRNPSPSPNDKPSASWNCD